MTPVCPRRDMARYGEIWGDRCSPPSGSRASSWPGRRRRSSTGSSRRAWTASSLSCSMSDSSTQIRTPATHPLPPRYPEPIAYPDGSGQLPRQPAGRRARAAGAHRRWALQSKESINQSGRLMDECRCSSTLGFALRSPPSTRGIGLLVAARPDQHGIQTSTREGALGLALEALSGSSRGEARASQRPRTNNASGVGLRRSPTHASASELPGNRYA